MAATVAATALLASCSNGGDTASPTTAAPPSVSSSPQATPTSTTSPTETSAPTSLDSLTPVVQGLVDRYDLAVTAILADPRVAGDDTNEHVVTYSALFPPASSFAAGALKAWASEGSLGHFYRPGPKGQMFTSRVVSVSVESADELTAEVCATTSLEVVDAGGALLESQGGTSGGQIEARRVNGVWLIEELSEVSGDAACSTSGAGA